MNKFFFFENWKYQNHTTLYFGLLFLILYGVSCKSVERIFVGEPSVDMNTQKLINSVISSDLVYDNLFFKRVQYDFEFEGQARSLKGSLYISKNSEIVFSVTPLFGIEIFRVLLQPNEVTIIDRLNKKVIITNYSFIKKNYLFDLDFYLFQDILTNSFFTYPNNLPFEDNRFKAFVANNSYTLQTIAFKTKNPVTSSKNNPQQVINILPEIYKISSSTILLPVNQTIFKVNYSNLKYFEKNFYFPGTIEMEGVHISDRINVTFNISQLEVNSKQSISAHIPDSYEKVYY